MTNAQYLPGNFFGLWDYGTVTAPSPSPSIVTLKGTGLGDYTTTSGTYVDVDGTNLSYTATISTGSKVIIIATGRIYSIGGTHAEYLALTDGTTVLQELANMNIPANPGIPFALSFTFVGDNNSHTFKLRYHDNGAGATCGIGNTSATDTPQMILWLGIAT